MTVQQLLATIGGGTKIQLFSSCEQVFLGKMSETSGKEIKAVWHKSVIHVNINAALEAITIAC